ncbi:MAG: sialidase family protein [Thermoplasmatota archaeon]
MRSAFACAALALLLLAGCVADKPQTPPPQPPPATMPEGVVVHDAKGELVASGTWPSLTPHLFDVGGQTFEPTLGVDGKGAIFFGMAGTNGVAIGFDPDVMRSLDNGTTWKSVGPRLPTGQSIPPETNDPFIYVDPGTGRLFQFAMAPISVCSILSWSDDQGATWTTNPHGCGNSPPWDHQSMVAAKPRGVPTVGYPNVLHQCVNEVAGAWCSRSVDGGLTWAPGTFAYTFQSFAKDALTSNCSGSSVHGHPVADQDGRVYLPTSMCGHFAVVAVSEDDGTTWTTVSTSDIRPANADPTMAVDAAGNVYFAFTDMNGTLRLTSSKDHGKTWAAPVQASPPGVTTNIPAMSAGDAGKLVLAYPGTTDLAKGFGSKGEDKARWDGYMTVALGAGDLRNATFLSVTVNPADDPLVRGPCGPGRCPGFADFMDVRVGPDGRAYAAFVDACTEKCATEGKSGADNNDGAAVLGKIDEPLFGRPFLYGAAGNSTAGR